MAAYATTGGHGDGVAGLPSVLPRPRSVAPGTGAFRLGPDTTLAAPPALAEVAGWLRAALTPATGLPLPPPPASPLPAPAAASLPPAAAVLSHPPVAASSTRSAPPHEPGGGPGAGGIALALDPALPPEAYRLRVTPERVEIDAAGPAGAFYGAQTLRQLLPPAAYRRARVGDGPWELPAVEIVDAPRFAWRGCLLDVARHFLPKADVLRFVDLLALHKLNVLQLHLTDDQGWRLESARYPRLTEVGAGRTESMRGSRQHGTYDGRPHGGYYTADDIREIVAYAAERQVTVVPEIDLPGHTQAAIAAYPWLGNGDAPVPVRTGWGISSHVLNVSDEALAFCRDILDEVCDLFPGRYVGIGGDECRKDEWRASPAARARMRELGLADEEALQSWFVGQLGAHLASRGRQVYGWDEIMEGGAPPGATVAAWRGTAPAVLAARAGHDVVACPDMWTYLDYRQSDRDDEPVPVGTVLTLADVYAFEPVPAGLTAAQAERVIGAQCNVWTEHMDSVRAVDYMVFPRLCAFAETVWCDAGRDYPGFRARLDAHLPRLAALGVEYRRESGPLPWQTRPDARGWPRTAEERRAQLAALTANLRPDPAAS
ncbi:beta-N-acetylhexosaminidase [Micromonospora sp. NPDC049559]|uniref:beta-N-acetylhexosaminidase n=1 Tax=Micromonospora sp. NPDC049559 TaxID=3155923 RepID=UPI0034146C84